MSPTAAFAVLWMAPDGRPGLLDVDGDGPEAFLAAQRIATDLVELGRASVRLVVTDLERISEADWAEARARLVKGRVLLEATKILREVAG